MAGQTTFRKREKEKQRQERAQEKAEQRKIRKEEKDKGGTSTAAPGEDPDIAGIIPGPQPVMED